MAETLPAMAEVLSSATVRYSPAVLDRALAAHDAQVRREAKAEALREWAAAMLDRYPEDVFVPPTRDDWDWVARLISQHGGVLDAFSAEIMRRAAHIAIKDADAMTRQADVPVADDERCGWCGITPTHDPGDCAVAKAHESQRLADIEQAVADEGRADA